MATLTRAKTWAAGETLTASDLNAEFDNALSTINGNLNAANLGVTAGVAAPSKALVLDASRDLDDTSTANQIRHLTISGNAAVGGNLTVTGTSTFNGGTITLGDAAGDTVTIGGTIQGNLIFEGSTANAYELTLAPADVTADRTLTMPDATDTLVGRATTDTLTNKTITSATLNTPTITGTTTFSDGSYNFNIASHDGTNGLALAGTVVTSSAAELNLVDGVTAGTVAASKAVVVDSDKDIASFRNVTLTGELDAATGDFSGDVDVDGTLEADAITLGGTALGSIYSPIAGSSSIVTVGTVGTGTWQGTAVAVSYGGTGASSLTDGGVLLGNGTGAVTAMAVLGDGEMIVGDGTTDPVAESGATLRTSVGVGTGDSPQFTGIELSHASENTLTASSGILSIESVAIPTISSTHTLTNKTWNGAVIASAYLDADTAHLGVTQTFTGAKTFTNTVTVGVNDAGHDVILYGDAASANITWDASEDDLIANGAARIVVPDGQMVLGSTAISSTAAEINLLDALSRGSILYGNASGATAVLTKGGSGTVLTSDGTDISWGAASGGGHTIQEEGSGLTQRANLNFVGAAVTATDNSGADTTIVTIGAENASLPLTRSGGASDPITLSSVAVGQDLSSDSSPQLGGNLDVNGQSIVSASNGNIQITPNGTGSVLVGVNDTGHDVKFFGATSGKYMEWDESADQLNVLGTALINSGATRPIAEFTSSHTNRMIVVSADTETANDTVGIAFNATASSAIGSTHSIAAIEGKVTQAGTLKGDLIFHVNAGDSYTEGMRLDSAGNLLLGGTTTTTNWTASGKLFIEGAIPGIGLRDTTGSADDYMIVNSNGVLTFANDTENTQPMVLDSSGRIGVGCTAPSSYQVNADSKAIVIGTGGTSGSPNVHLTLASDDTGNGRIAFTDTVDSTNQAYMRYDHNNANWDFTTAQSGGLFKFSPDTGGSVLMQIGDASSNARVGIGTTSPAFFLDVVSNVADYAIRSLQSHATGSHLRLHFNSSGPDNNSAYFLTGFDNTANRIFLYSDGDIANHDGTYGTISDVKLKQDIEDVRSYWDDFKSLQYRKFRHKTDVVADADAPFRLGLVAQEVETVFPALVPESPDPDIETQEAVVDDDGEAVLDDDGNPTYETVSTPSGTTHKWVKSSIIEGPIMGSVVQELQTRLEAAEAKIATLESA